MKLIRADWIVVSAILLYGITLFTTNFYINYKMELAEQINIEKEVVLIAEQNPLARYLLLFNNYKYIYMTIVIPSLVVGIYVYYRNKYLSSNPHLIEAIAIMLFIGYLYNVINDISILLGVLLQ